MEKIERLDDVKRLLVDQEILMIMKDGNPVFFVKRKDKILVKSQSSTYRISLDDLENLFRDEVFYLYDDVQQETVNLEKDEEYYTWRARYQ